MKANRRRRGEGEAWALLVYATCVAIVVILLVRFASCGSAPQDDRLDRIETAIERLEEKP